MQNNQIIIGVDEAGRGPWAGPVVAAAVYLPEELSFQDSFLYNQITDSKKLSASQREKIFSFLRAKAFAALGAACPLYIDKFNILEATFFAMRQSIFNLQKILSAPIDKVLVDGNQKIPGLSISQEAIVKGDFREKNIAAASIIAKVTRDRLMVVLDQKYPQYCFAEHKGYGTMKHREMLSQFGICAIHRKSFKPIKQFII
ncbi:ribonuclease HII [bacterium (Candidatus Torokbacteria) CG09_land_8_20_14_0_10_42_11]|nr:MAG: ribonuclease HII [bacterium (Candidatus Torokbacteria) CG09_land_8_20_14_0_10_42_11]